MVDFKVHALTANGVLEEHIISGSTEDEIRQVCRSSGLNILTIQPIKQSIKIFNAKSNFDLAIFSHELLCLLKAGLSLIETLETLKERLKAGQAGFNLISDLIRKMREGQSFSSVLKNHSQNFPPLFIASISASEQTGNIIEALERYLRYHEQMNVIKQKIISASIYPVLLLLVGSAVAIFLLCFLVPRFSHVYEGIDTDLPFASKLLIEWGTLLNEHFSLVLIVFFIALIFIYFLIKQPSLKRILGTALTNNPWIGSQYRLLQLSRFYRSLGLLLSGGIPIVKALKMTQGLLSESLSRQVNFVIIDIQQGKGLTTSLTTANLSTAVANRLLGAGEKNGQLAEMLEQISMFHDKEINIWIDKFTRLFEPILMLVIGLIIGGIVVLLYLPIFELAGSLA